MRYKILSIDGGGVKGIISSIWLAELEKRLKKPLYKYFDLIIGTSSGAIISCGVGCGRKAKNIADLFEISVPRIFPQTSNYWPYLYPFLGPKYPSKGLEDVLKENFQNSKFGDLKTSVAAIAYNLSSRKTEIFFNEHDKNLLVWDVCRASASAPLWFKPHVMTYKDNKYTMIDGAVSANNPAPFGILQSLRRNKEPFLVSIGCGSLENGLDPDDVISNWKHPKWVGDITLNIENSISDYHRIQGFVEHSGRLDDSSEGNIEALKYGALEWGYDNPDVFDKVAHSLENISTPTSQSAA